MVIEVCGVEFPTGRYPIDSEDTPAGEITSQLKGHITDDPMIRSRWVMLESCLGSPAKSSSMPGTS